MRRKLLFILPFIFLAGLLGILYHELFYSNPRDLPSALIGEDLPAFALPMLNNPQKMFTPKDLQGRAALLNVWSTWCYACNVEHEMLVKIKTQYHVPIYGIIYKDDPNAAKAWLTEQGNPYVMVASDNSGDAAIDLGVYATPETFVINPNGKIIYRYVGVITEEVWNEELYPLIKQFETK